MRQVLKIATVVALFLASAGAAVAQVRTLDAVKARGALICGVNTGFEGFARPDDKGNWTGIDVDYCKALAAVVLGDASKVTYMPTTGKNRFTALQSGEIDILLRNTSWTMSRESFLGLIFAGVNYYDGQAFMVKKTLGVKSAKDLSGATVCVVTGTTTELNLADYFRANKMDYKLVVFEKGEDLVKAYEAGRCDVDTGDVSALLAQRLHMSAPAEHVVLPEIISKEPLGPLVRQGDSQWFTIVKWLHYALLTAEEFGVTQANVDEMAANPPNPDVKRLLGKEGDFGKGLGLDNDWAVKAIKAVGNYGELFERNIGTGSRLQMARGLNAQWSQGGLQYAPPIR
jgi:general L-amino acid transport system substrate-binding protein